MGGGTTTRAAGLAAGALGVSAGAGSTHGALPAAAGVVGGTARHGRPPLIVSVSDSSPPCAALVTERGGGRRHPPHPCFCDEDGLESAGEEDADWGAGCGFVEGYVFGPAPSREEVLVAISAIHQVFFPLTFPLSAEDQFSSTAGKDTKDETLITDATRHRVPSTGSRLDCIEPARELYGSNYIQYQVHDNVLDACRSFQINPIIQSTSFSLSSDKAIWDAVMKNEAVKEIRKSICRAQVAKSPTSDYGYDVLLERLLKWIIECTKEKVIELANKIVNIVKEILLFHEKDKVEQVDPLEDAIRSSFMLTIMVFIVVVITRYHKALQ